jgi:hypothetical protein
LKINPVYKKFFIKALKESGPNYVATIPNTAGRGGAVGNSPNMYTTGSATGTTGTDAYAPGDMRVPSSLYGGKMARRNTVNRFPKRTRRKK